MRHCKSIKGHVLFAFFGIALLSFLGFLGVLCILHLFGFLLLYFASVCIVLAVYDLQVSESHFVHLPSLASLKVWILECLALWMWDLNLDVNNLTLLLR